MIFLDDAFKQFYYFFHKKYIRPTQVHNNQEQRFQNWKQLLNTLGLPDTKHRIIHIAGSKGKGTCAHLLKHILTQLNVSVGLYTSPHLFSYQERINGFPSIDEAIYLAAMKQLMYYFHHHPSLYLSNFFELFTLLAFIIFREKKYEYLIIETGLGGRWDATNIVNPILSIITLLEYEHTQILGASLEKITQEKGGIIKPYIPCVLGYQKYFSSVHPVIEKIARQNKSDILFLNDNEYLFKYTDHVLLNKQKLYSFSPGYLDNIHTVYSSLYFLSQSDPLFHSFRTLNYYPYFFNKVIYKEPITIPGRCQQIQSKPPIILDVSHTYHSILNTFQISYYSSSYIRHLHKPILLFSLSQGKDIYNIAHILLKKSAYIIVCDFHIGTQHSVANLYQLLQKEKNRYQSNISITYVPNAYQALDLALLKQKEQPLLICGSFYLISSLYPYLKKKKLL